MCPISPPWPISEKSVNCPDKYLNATVPLMKCEQTEIRKSRQMLACWVLKAISLKLRHSQECLSIVLALECGQNCPLSIPHFPSFMHFLFCHIKQDKSHVISGKWEVISQHLCTHLVYVSFGSGMLLFCQWLYGSENFYLNICFSVSI